ncbi:hypothetical protein GQ53DRAFT_760900 [Thozetella sp. PMI_491]|nr:hypothetical protein GQ53DRAFT_760900 [Thozetella sp. PMI_491]
MSLQGADDGWTHVVRKDHRGPRRARPPQQDESETAEVPPNQNPTFSLQDIRKYHEGIRAEWEASQCCKTLKTLVSGHLRGRPAVTTAICLGPGSFDPATGSWAARRAAHLQIEAFKTLAHALGDSCGRRVVQEPAFTPTDKSFCAELGLEVAENSDAFAMIDSGAVVFGIHLYIRTWHEALRVLPAMFVGTGLDSWQTTASFKPDVEALLGPLAQMHESYDQFSFPDMGNIFTGTCVYWRKEPATNSDMPPAASLAGN